MRIQFIVCLGAWAFSSLGFCNEKNKRSPQGIVSPGGDYEDKNILFDMSEDQNTKPPYKGIVPPGGDYEDNILFDMSEDQNTKPPYKGIVPPSGDGGGDNDMLFPKIEHTYALVKKKLATIQQYTLKKVEEFFGDMTVQKYPPTEEALKSFVNTFTQKVAAPFQEQLFKLLDQLLEENQSKNLGPVAAHLNLKVKIAGQYFEKAMRELWESLGKSSEEKQQQYNKIYRETMSYGPSRTMRSKLCEISLMVPDVFTQHYEGKEPNKIQKTNNVCHGPLGWAGRGENKETLVPLENAG